MLCIKVKLKDKYGIVQGVLCKDENRNRVYVPKSLRDFMVGIYGLPLTNGDFRSNTFSNAKVSKDLRIIPNKDTEIKDASFEEYLKFGIVEEKKVN